MLGLAEKAGYDVVAKGFVADDIINGIAEVRLDKKEVYTMANLAWEACIRDGLTMGEFQDKLVGA